MGQTVQKWMFPDWLLPHSDHIAACTPSLKYFTGKTAETTYCTKYFFYFFIFFHMNHPPPGVFCWYTVGCTVIKMHQEERGEMYLHIHYFSLATQKKPPSVNWGTGGNTGSGFWNQGCRHEMLVHVFCYSHQTDFSSLQWFVFFFCHSSPQRRSFRGR